MKQRLKKREEANLAGLGAIGTQQAELEKLLAGQKTETDALRTALTGDIDAVGKKTDALTSLIGAPADVNTGDVATGLYRDITDLGTTYDTKIDETQAFIDEQFKQQAAATAAKEDAAKKAATRRAQQQQQMQNVSQLYGALQPQGVEVKQAPLAQIGTPYDFQSIFRDAGQESFYQTPYQKGGQVVNINDKLLKLIGDS